MSKLLRIQSSCLPHFCCSAGQLRCGSKLIVSIRIGLVDGDGVLQVQLVLEIVESLEGVGRVDVLVGEVDYLVQVEDLLGGLLGDTSVWGHLDEIRKSIWSGSRGFSSKMDPQTTTPATSAKVQKAAHLSILLAGCRWYSSI